MGSSSGTVHVFSFEAYDKRFQVAGLGEIAGGLATGGTSSTHGAGATVPASRTYSRDSAGDTEPAKDVPGWKETIRSNSVSALGFVQNWAFSTVGSLNVLPEDMQEFSESVRAGSLARIPGAEGNFKIALITIPGDYCKLCEICNFLFRLLFPTIRGY